MENDSVSNNEEMTDHQQKSWWINLTAQNTVFLEMCSLKRHM